MPSPATIYEHTTTKKQQQHQINNNINQQPTEHNTHTLSYIYFIIIMKY